MTSETIVVGAGPTGLMLACELGLAGVRPLVLERREEISPVARAGGVTGRIRELLRYRGLLERLEEASPMTLPGGPFPWGGLQLDLTKMPDPPLKVTLLPQPELERLLEERARELGAEIRRGHEVVGLGQDTDEVVAEVRGPDGAYRVTAPYLVACDGARSPIREAAGIPFPGSTLPEVQRMAQVTRPDSIALLDDGAMEVPGFGRVEFGHTWTERGLFAFSGHTGDLSLFTSEEEDAAYDDDAPLTAEEMRASVRRVLGADIPIGEASRLVRFTFHDRLAERFREGRVFLAGDAAHLLPAPGAGLTLDMMDAVNLGWKLALAVQGRAPEGLLDTYEAERRHAAERALLQTRAQAAVRRGNDALAQALRDLIQELLADEPAARRIGEAIAGADVGAFAPELALEGGLGAHGRPVLLDLADRPELRDAASGRAEVVVAETEDRPVDALLIRPDGHIAWAGGEPRELAAAAERWCGVA